MANMKLLLLSVGLLLVVELNAKAVNFLERRKGEIEGEDAEVERLRSATQRTKGADLDMLVSALPLPPLPPSTSPHLPPTAREFTFSMMIQPSIEHRTESLEADETDEALLLRPPHPTTQPARTSTTTSGRPQLPAESSRKNVGFVDEYSDDPFEGEARRPASKSSPGRPN